MNEKHSGGELRMIAAFYKAGTVKGAAELAGVSEQTAKNQLHTARIRAHVSSNMDLVKMYWKTLTRNKELQSIIGLNSRQIRYRFDEEYREQAKKQAREGMRKIRATQATGLREHYDRLLSTQGNVCAICGQAEGARRNKDGAPVRLSVDHDHASGAIRELLCSGCNLMLGCAKDDPTRLEAGAAYLRKHAGSMSHKFSRAEDEAA